MDIQKVAALVDDYQEAPYHDRHRWYCRSRVFQGGIQEALRRSSLGGQEVARLAAVACLEETHDSHLLRPTCTKDDIQHEQGVFETKKIIVMQRTDGDARLIPP